MGFFFFSQNRVFTGNKPFLGLNWLPLLLILNEVTLAPSYQGHNKIWLERNESLSTTVYLLIPQVLIQGLLDIPSVHNRNIFPDFMYHMDIKVLWFTETFLFVCFWIFLKFRWELILPEEETCYALGEASATKWELWVIFSHKQPSTLVSMWAPWKTLKNKSRPRLIKYRGPWEDREYWDWDWDLNLNLYF